MTKKEIVKKISEDIGLTQLKTKDIVQRTLDAIIHTLGLRRADRTAELRRLRGQASAPGRHGTLGPATRFTSRPRTW